MKVSDQKKPEHISIDLMHASDPAKLRRLATAGEKWRAFVART